MGQRPIVAVVGDAQLYLSRRDLRYGIAHHLLHLGKGGHRHGWAVGIPPLVRHQEHRVSNGSHSAVIVALVKKPLLVRMGLGGQIYVKRQAHLVQPVPGVAQEGQEIRPVLPGDVLKIHVQTLVPLFQ